MDLSQLYASAGDQYGVDPDLLHATALVESGENPNATGPATKYGQAQGITQLIPATAESLGVTDASDPNQAVSATAKLYAENLKRYKGDLPSAVGAYHGGTDQKNWGPKTKAYQDKVLATYQKLKDARNAQQSSPQVPQVVMNQPQDVSDDDFMRLFENAAPVTEPSTSQPTATTNTSAEPTDEDFLRLLDKQEVTTAPSQGISKEGQDQKTLSSEGYPRWTKDGRLEMAPGVFNDAAKNRADFAAGLGRVPNDLLNSVDKVARLIPGAEQLRNKIGNVTLGGLFPTADETDAKNKLLLDEYEKQYGDNPNAQVGRFLGQAYAGGKTLGAIGKLAGGTGEILGATGSRIADAVPALGDIGNGLLNTGKSFVSNPLIKYPTRWAAGGVKGNLSGQALGALLSGASNRPIEDQMKESGALGTVIGAGTPMIYDTLKGSANFAKNTYEPFTKGGRQNIVNKIIKTFAGDAPLTVNPNEIVPGSSPTLAEATGNPGLASLEDTLRQSSPNNQFSTRLAERGEARNSLLANLAGTPAETAAARESLAAQTTDKLENIFTNSNNISPTPILTKVQNILDEAGGNRPAIKQSMADVTNMMHRDGQAITDPNDLYQSVRKGIGDLLDKKDLLSSHGRQAARQLLDVQDTVDNTIESGAPGFKSYLADYADKAKEIEGTEFLQNLKLTNVRGEITLGNVQRALGSIEKLRAAPGVNEAKSLTDTQLDVLRSLRDDMLRQDKTEMAAMPLKQSATVMRGNNKELLNSMLPGKTGLFAHPLLSKSVLGSAGYAVGNATGLPLAGPILGGAGVSLGGSINNSLMSRSNEVRTLLENMMLNPSSYSPVSNSNGLMSSLLQGPGAQAIRPYLMPAAIAGLRPGNAVPTVP